MQIQRANKLLALLGSVCLSNGLLLLVEPARFANLRKLDWMHQGYNSTLERLPPHSTASRALGAGLSGTGLVLLLVALRRTEPASG